MKDCVVVVVVLLLFLYLERLKRADYYYGHSAFNLIPCIPSSARTVCRSVCTMTIGQKWPGLSGGGGGLPVDG